MVGDGALTGGMAWEALNNIAIDDDLPLVIVVNDNGRSCCPTVGGLSRHLSVMRADPRYEQTLDVLKHTMNCGAIGRRTYDLLHGMKTGLKDMLASQVLFSDLGLKYLGPIDGHDIDTLTCVLRRAAAFGAPVIVHAITQKGRGFQAAEEHETDHFHAVGRIDSVTGELLSAVVRATSTDAFAQEMVQLGEQHPEVVALTAAMLHPVGPARFAAAFP